MTLEETEALTHRWHMDIFVAGNLGLVDQIVAPNFTAHANGQDFPGAEGAKQLATLIRTAFPDVQIQHHDVITSGDRTAIRWTSDSTHKGDYLGVAPTGRPIHIEGIDFFHVQNGKITEVWIEYDNLGVLQQMGAVPQPQQA